MSALLVATCPQAVKLPALLVKRVLILETLELRPARTVNPEQAETSPVNLSATPANLVDTLAAPSRLSVLNVQPASSPMQLVPKSVTIVPLASTSQCPVKASVCCVRLVRPLVLQDKRIALLARLALLITQRVSVLVLSVSKAQYSHRLAKLAAISVTDVPSSPVLDKLNAIPANLADSRTSREASFVTSARVVASNLSPVNLAASCAGSEPSTTTRENHSARTATLAPSLLSMALYHAKPVLQEVLRTFLELPRVCCVHLALPTRLSSSPSVVTALKADLQTFLAWRIAMTALVVDSRSKLVKLSVISVLTAHMLELQAQRPVSIAQLASSTRA